MCERFKSFKRACDNKTNIGIIPLIYSDPILSLKFYINIYIFKNHSLCKCLQIVCNTQHNCTDEKVRKSSLQNQHIRERKGTSTKNHKERRAEQCKMLPLPAVTVGHQLITWEDVLLEKPRSSGWGDAAQTPEVISGACMFWLTCLFSLGFTKHRGRR